MNPQREWTSDSKRNLWNCFKSKRVTKSFPGNYWNNYKWFSFRIQSNRCKWEFRCRSNCEKGWTIVWKRFGHGEYFNGHTRTNESRVYHTSPLDISQGKEFTFFLLNDFYSFFILNPKREPFSQLITHWRLDYE